MVCRGCYILQRELEKGSRCGYERPALLVVSGAMSVDIDVLCHEYRRYNNATCLCRFMEYSKFGTGEARWGILRRTRRVEQRMMNTLRGSTISPRGRLYATY